MDYSIDLVVDTSAFAAILFQEAEAGEFLKALSNARYSGISAANKTELLIVVRGRLGADGVAKALELLRMYDVAVIPVDDAIAELAADAFARFGKGRHPAGLNFGDCFSFIPRPRHRSPHKTPFTGERLTWDGIFPSRTYGWQKTMRIG